MYILYSDNQLDGESCNGIYSLTFPSLLIFTLSPNFPPLTMKMIFSPLSEYLLPMRTHSTYSENWLTLLSFLFLPYRFSHLRSTTSLFSPFLSHHPYHPKEKRIKIRAEKRQKDLREKLLVPLYPKSSSHSNVLSLFPSHLGLSLLSSIFHFLTLILSLCILRLSTILSSVQTHIRMNKKVTKHL